MQTTSSFTSFQLLYLKQEDDFLQAKADMSLTGDKAILLLTGSLAILKLSLKLAVNRYPEHQRNTEVGRKTEIVGDHVFMILMSERMQK